MQRISSYRSQLVLRMLQHLSLATEGLQQSQDKRFDRLEQKIVQVLAVTEDRFEAIGSQGAALSKQMNEVDTRGIIQRDKVLSAILTLQNGETRVIAPPGTFQQRAPGDNGHQSVLTMKAGGAESVTGSVEMKEFQPIQEMILNSLYFRHYSDRLDSVKEAHSSTFRWALTDEVSEEHKENPVPWSSLIQWLESGSGCYWISGKAGSGKSTLLKYIMNDPKLDEALGKWTEESGERVTKASFFFWNLGTMYQKTQEGLLRSLLYDVLRQHPGLIPTVMPEMRLLGAKANRNNLLDAPTFTELVRWLKLLLDQTSPQFRIFFLIDGIDEYEGDHADVVHLLDSVADNPNAKFLISSRPLPVCVDAFSKYPNLKLQDLTRGDIRNYAEELIGGRLLTMHEKQEKEEIIETIVDKSCGVFLWVVLVIRSLLAGLQNCDDINELRRRLDEFPSEIKDLYAAMFKKMPPVYRQQASELFQMSLIANEVQKGEHRLTPIQLHFARYDEEQLLKTPVKVLTVAKETQMVEFTEGRVRARCAGLLELRSVNFRMEGMFRSKVVKHVYIDFIHRTAVEFLQLPEVWTDLLTLTEGSGFNPAVGLCHSCVLLCKIAARESPILLEDSQLWYYMDRAMHYASMAERDGINVMPGILDDLNATMTTQWNSVDTCFINYKTFDEVRASKSAYWRHLGKSFCETKKHHWTSAYGLSWEDSEPLSITDEINAPSFRRILKEAAKPMDFYTMATFYCLTNFLESKSSVLSSLSTRTNVSDQDGNEVTINISAASRLLYDATNNMLFKRPWPGNRDTKQEMALKCPEICSYLLLLGADPNAEFGLEKESPWALMVEYALLHQPAKQQFWQNFDFGGFAHTYSRLLVNFLDHGGDVNREVSVKERKGFKVGLHRPDYSALGALDALYAVKKEAINPGESSASLYSFPAPSAYASRASNISQSGDLEAFYSHLRGMMVERGAVLETRSSQKRRERKRLGDMEAMGLGGGSGRSSQLMVPRDGRRERPKSTDRMTGGLRSMFGKFHKNVKGSVET